MSDLPPIEPKNLPNDDDTTEAPKNRTRAMSAEETQRGTVPTEQQPVVPQHQRSQTPAGTGHVQRQVQQPTTPQPPRTAQQTQAPYPPPRRRRNRRKKDDSALYFPWWSLALMLMAVVIVAFGLVGLVYVLGNPTGIVEEPTPIIQIITAQPTAASAQFVQPTAQAPATVIIAGGNAPTNLSLAGPTLEAVQFTPTPIAITIGSRIAVTGVDDQKLNVRDVSGVTASTVLFRADEGEVFTVIEGPLQADGFSWWRIQDPLNGTRTGWAVANYLQVVVEQ